jgi:hypothetical protein
MKPPSARQVTLPTTAGEFSAYSGITDERHRRVDPKHPDIAQLQLVRCL